MAEKVLMSIKEVAKHLGLEYSKTRVLISAGVIPSVRIGRRFKVKRNLLDEWIANGCRGCKVDDIHLRKSERKSELSRLLYKPTDVMAILSVCRTTIYGLLQTGEIKSIRIGKSIRITAKSISDYLERLEQEEDQPKN